MQFSQLTIAALATLAPLAHAVGNAIVENNCGNPIYLWSVDSNVGPEQKVMPGEAYSEKFRRDEVTGGITIKVTRVDDGLYNGSPQTNFALSLKDGRIWYDLSNVFGDPFEGKSVAVTPSFDSCPSIVWENGVPPGENQTRDCEADSDVTLSLC